MGVRSRNGKARALLAAAMAVAAVTAWACADPGTSPTWELVKDYPDPGGNAALLMPGNDTRTNLLLLLADRRGATVRDPAAPREGTPLVLFPWKVMSAAASPPPKVEGDSELSEPSRCQSQAGGAAGFIAAVNASAQLPAQEKPPLAAARAAFVPNCTGVGTAPPAAPVESAAGKAFVAYLAGAAAFYGGRFDAARAAFAGLAGAPDPWLRETGLYMVARTELNRAQQGSFDEYGSLAPPEKRDLKAIAAADAAFGAYLKAYPAGRYAASARGLTRRVAWLAGRQEALAAAYDRQLAQPGPFDGAATAVAMVEEIDLTLLTEGGTAAHDPLLLAVADLRAMRCYEGSDECASRLGAEALARQAPLFAREAALYGYLRAAQAFFVRHQPREVLALIPDSARQKRFSYVEFSRQVLRGMALEAVHDRNARGFWLSLFDGAAQPYQRDALELALALHEERSGGVARIFEPDSRVRHPVIRQMLIEHVAGPDLLRKQARDGRAPKQEREVATFVLLSKDLLHGFYKDFLDDLRLMPAASATDAEAGYYAGAVDYDAVYSDQLAPPPLGRFRAGAKPGETGCPALEATVRQLAAAPGTIRARLCLAEFFRNNGFDDFPLDRRIEGHGLATSAPQFPGAPQSRLEVYKAVIADPAASDDDRALALNRAIRCYAPTGSNSCGGTEVGVEQRRAWFNRLKRDYPRSRWAQSLKIYW